VKELNNVPQIDHALFNSKVFRFLYPQISPKMQGGFMRYKAQYLKGIPVPASITTHGGALTTLVDYLLWTNQFDSTPRKEPETGAKAVMLSFFDFLLNGLVYNLFFPDDLHSHKINLFKLLEEGRLPVLADIPEKQRFSRLEGIYERISSDRHPIRGCLESLKSLEVVRMIENME
jgi:adenine-specific DNA-methyltransferase